MPVIALCAAQALADDVDAWGMPVLRAMLPVAGMTVIEQQAESARASGIGKMLVLVDAVPPALAEACDRITARGMAVALVRDAADVVEHSSDAAMLLLVADGLIAGAAAWRMACAAMQPAVLTTDDGPVTASLERIDATTRWAGLSMIDRSMLDSLSDAPPGWDPQLVLFRQAVQSGTPMVACDPALFVSGEMTVAESPDEAAGAEQRMMANGAMASSGVFDRWVGGPVLQLLSGPLLRNHASGTATRAATVVLALAAGAAALLGQPVVMALCGLSAAISHLCAAFVARFRPETAMWSGVGGTAMAAQLVALAIADRQMTLLQPGPWWGSGGMTATVAMVLGLLVPAVVRMPTGRLVDMPTVWIGVLAMMPALGWRGAFDAVGILAGLVLAANLLLVIRANASTENRAA